MHVHYRMTAFVAVLASVCTLPGCAAYQQCGFHGCPGDAQLARAVQAQIDEHPALTAPNMVRAQVIGGVAYLTGELNTDQERYTAEEVARQVPGVKQVVDSIFLSNVGR